MIQIFNYIPEISLTLFSLTIIVYITTLKYNNNGFHHINNTTTATICFIALLTTFFLLFYCDSSNVFSTEDIIISSLGGNTLKKIIIFLSILALAPIAYSFNLQKLSYFEFYPLYLIAVLSSLLMVNATDFLSVYLIIEIQSLCFYILATFRKDSIFSIKAGLKYFIFGSLASCLFLFALSFLYGALGTLHFYKLYLILYCFPFSENFLAINALVVFSLFLISIVLLFKLGIAPFHYWLPDVYEGAPISTTIVFSVLPKLAMFDLFIRISKVFGEAFKELEVLFLVVGILSILIGSVSAILQTRLKRFLIFSSISQMGFPIILLSSHNVDFASSIYFFVIFYSITSILTWTVYTLAYKFSGKLYLSKGFSNQKAPLYLTDLSNLITLDSSLSYFFALIFFSSAGIPPLPGFLIKFSIVLELIKAYFYSSSIAILFITVISTFYYVRLIKILLFEVGDLKTRRFNLLSESSDDFLLKLNYIVALICFFMIIHSFFFVDSWLILSQYIYFNIFPS